MNYSDLRNTLIDDLDEAVALICNPEIDPEIRRRNLEILLRESGETVYDVIYKMNAYDMGIEYISGLGIDDYYYTLAREISDSICIGGYGNRRDMIEDYLLHQIDKAQWDAFESARVNNMHPRATRVERYNCCSFCRDRAYSEENPGHEIFRRHERCRGKIYTSGWRSRNGTLSGYGWQTIK